MHLLFITRNTVV